MAASVQAAPSASEQVQSAFQAYREALLRNDGPAAWDLMDAGTEKYYAEALSDAMSLPQPDLARLDFIAKFMVLRLRLEFRKPELQRLSARDVFVHAVEKGWISRSSVERITGFDRIEIEGHLASGYLAASGSTPVFHFIHEGGRWKLSLWKIMELGNAGIAQLLKEQNVSEDELMLHMLRSVSKYEVDPRIYEGPLE
jgi:hypothetical protein